MYGPTGKDIAVLLALTVVAGALLGQCGSFAASWIYHHVNVEVTR